MRNSRSVCLAALTAIVVLIGPAAVADYKAMVVDVTAGDIYQVENTSKKKQMVVLYGVVAPTKPAAARLARETGIQKALGQQVTVRVVQQRPGMTLVELTLPDGTNLSHTMLRAGLLQWDSLTAAGDQGLKDLENLAKADRLGVWADVAPDGAASAKPGTPAAMKDERRFERRLSADYDILEGRAYTDEKGVPTLVLRGNGQKIVGFEHAAEQQRIDQEAADAEAAEWAAMDAAAAQAEAEQAAAEQQRQIDDAAARDAQMQNLQMINDYVLFGGGRGTGITTIPLNPY